MLFTVSGSGRHKTTAFTTSHTIHLWEIPATWNASADADSTGEDGISKTAHETRYICMKLGGSVGVG